MTTTCWSRRRVLALSSLIAPLGVSAQRATKTNGRIGVLWLGEKTSTFGPRSREVFFRDSLRQLGWVEGQNLAIDTRFVGDGLNISREVEGLLAMKVDVIVAMGSPIALAAKNMTSSVPVVFVVFGDPVEFKLIDSLPRPGRNLTGIYLPTADHAGKRLGLLHDAVLGSTRIAVLRFPPSQATRESRITAAAAAKLGVELIDLNVGSIADLESAFVVCKKSGAKALTILTEPRASTNLRRLADMSIAQKLPAIAGYDGFAWLGGFMSYGADGLEGIRRAAYFITKILDGARPADLPVEQSTKYVLALNVKTARKLGLSFPRALVQYANVVIS